MARHLQTATIRLTVSGFGIPRGPIQQNTIKQNKTRPKSDEGLYLWEFNEGQREGVEASGLQSL